MPSLPEPPDDQSENRAWIDEQAERVAVLARTQLRKIVLRAYDAYLSTLTAAGDLAAFDSIPQEWGVFVGEQLLDEIDGVYRSGAVAAWNQAPTTAALGESAALAWAAVVNEDAVSYAAQASNRLAGVGHDIWMKVNSEVTEAIRQGTGTEALKNEIERLTGFSEFRADTIARTEIGSAFVNGNYEAQVALGEYGAVFKEWLSVSDARTRPEHAALDGTVIPFDDMFDAGGEMMRAPHDETASAGNVINCRCDVLWYYPGDTLPDGTLVEAPTITQGTAGSEIAEELQQVEQVVPQGQRFGDIPEDGWKKFTEARAYLETQHPHVTWAKDMAQWDRRMVREVARWADDMSVRFPEQWRRMEYVGSQTVANNTLQIPKYDFGDTRELAHAYTSRAERLGRGAIGINPKYAKDFDLFTQMKQEGNRVGFSIGDSARDTLTHEFGHIYDGLMRKQWRDMSYPDELLIGPSRSFKYFDARELDAWIREVEMRNMPNYGSKYGSVNSSEAFAESFNALVRGDAKAGRLVAVLDDITSISVKGAPDYASTAEALRGEADALRRLDQLLARHGITERPPGYGDYRSTLTSRLASEGLEEI